jgi:hypothetical protein
LANNFFGGLVDLSIGVIATLEFENKFTLTAVAGVNQGGNLNLNSPATCLQGLELQSNFIFKVDAFAT